MAKLEKFIMCWRDKHGYLIGDTFHIRSIEYSSINKLKDDLEIAYKKRLKKIKKFRKKAKRIQRKMSLVEIDIKTRLEKTKKEPLSLKKKYQKLVGYFSRIESRLAEHTEFVFFNGKQYPYSIVSMNNQEYDVEKENTWDDFEYFRLPEIYPLDDFFEKSKHKDLLTELNDQE